MYVMLINFEQNENICILSNLIIWKLYAQLNSSKFWLKKALMYIMYDLST